MTTKEFDEFLHHIIITLENLNLQYAIGGSVASSRYGEPRSTFDVWAAYVGATDLWQALLDEYHARI